MRDVQALPYGRATVAECRAWARLVIALDRLDQRIGLDSDEYCYRSNQCKSGWCRSCWIADLHSAYMKLSRSRTSASPSESEHSHPRSADFLRTSKRAAVP